MDYSLSILFIWFACKGNCSVCGSFFLFSGPVYTLRFRPRQTVSPSLASPWLTTCHHQMQEVPLRHSPLSWGWLKCRCRISAAAQTSGLAVAGNHTISLFLFLSPEHLYLEHLLMKIVKPSLLPCAPWFLQMWRNGAMSLADRVSPMFKFWAVSFYVHISL